MSEFSQGSFADTVYKKLANFYGGAQTEAYIQQRWREVSPAQRPAGKLQLISENGDKSAKPLRPKTWSVAFAIGVHAVAWGELNEEYPTGQEAVVYGEHSTSGVMGAAILGDGAGIKPYHSNENYLGTGLRLGRGPLFASPALYVPETDIFQLPALHSVNSLGRCATKNFHQHFPGTDLV